MKIQYLMGLALLGLIACAGCTKQEKTVAGAVIGAGAGAAVAGGAIGGVAGGLIGHSLGDDDK